ncbi:MAG: S24 family peptidase [Fusobacteriaceae bacterium]
MNVGKYVKEKRIQLGISLRQLSYKIGMSHTNISDFEKGQIKKKDTLIRIIDGLRLTADERSKAFELFGEDEISPKIKSQIIELKEENNVLKQENNELKELKENLKGAIEITGSKVIELPVYGKAAAGNGYINMENIIRSEYITVFPGEEFPKGAFVVEVCGESMYPTLLDGDSAIVDPQCSDKNMNNQICVVTYNGQTFIKRVSTKEKYISLISDNPDRIKYEDIVVPMNEFSDLRCHGIVIECRRKFRRR